LYIQSIHLQKRKKISDTNIKKLTMKIGIEGQRLFRKKKHGMDMVALELIKNLQKIDNTNEYVVFVAAGEDNTCIPVAPNFKIKVLPGSSYPVWEQIYLPKAAEKEKCDVLHCTSNTAPLFCSVPIITTIHDIIYLESISLFKSGFTNYQKIGNMYRRFIVPFVFKKSKKVITVSNFEKARIGNFFGGKYDEKLVAVYNGVGDHFVTQTNPEQIDSIRTKYSLPEKYIFFLGNTDPKKNTPGTLKAYSEYCIENGYEIKLVMLDFEHNKLEEILREIGNPKLKNNIHLTGYVNNLDLPVIYSEASLFLYPSYRESFGIPILEGMACGTPVITSNTSSMPEIAGDAALLVDPFNPMEIKEAITRIFRNKEESKTLIERGLERAKSFSWRTMAEDTLELYKELL